MFLDQPGKAKAYILLIFVIKGRKSQNLWSEVHPTINFSFFTFPLFVNFFFRFSFKFRL